MSSSSSHPGEDRQLALFEGASRTAEENTAPSAAVPPDQEPQQAVQENRAVNAAEQEREYGCKYCHKKFSNKQALGGHQNAHKVERAMEKSAREMHESQFGYMGGNPSYSAMNSNPFLASHNRSHEFMSRAVGNRPFYPPVHHGSIHIGGAYTARPGMAGEPYAHRPVSGHGWTASVPRTPQFAHPSYVQNYALNRRFATFGAGSSGGRPPFSEGPSSFPGTRPRPDRNPVGGGNNQQDDEDPDIDLSLKL
ncbi:Zinc finger protein 2 [Sesamum angolense]|uniref:Zinc finger protein 2 n=1 Tax=Sesamum angolense TaxID=2727404 RepID=A0AAE2C0N3_9LAMI|nr:Zinc finger protein 2 [Sesamum angolense]